MVLENLVLKCLEKEPDQRPISADALERTLEDCECTGSWSRQAAESWWHTNLPEGSRVNLSDDATPTASASTAS